MSDEGAASAWYFDTSNKSIIENQGSITFTLTRSNPVGQEAVYISTVQNWNGSGVYNQGDYSGKLGENLTFADGVAQRTVTINVTNDQIPENSETFGLIVQSSPNALLSSVLTSGAFTITDDDSTVPPPKTLLTAEQLFAIDGDKSVTLADFSLAAYDNADASQVQANLVAKGWDLLSSAELGGLSNFSNGIFTFGTGAALVAASQNALVISFRGTDNLANLHSDLPGWVAPEVYYAQFANLIDAIDHYANQPNQSINEVFVTGHSLGAAMVHQYMESHPDGTLGRTYEAVTFASPGSPLGSQFFPDQDSRTTNFRSEDDPIRIPADGDLIVDGAAAAAALAGYPTLAENLLI